MRESCPLPTGSVGIRFPTGHLNDEKRTMTVDVARELVLPAIKRHGDRCAVVADGQEWTYRDLHDSAMRVAGLLVEAGVQPGDPVAIVMENSAEYLVADLAVIAAGAAMVPINMMLSDEEVSYILRDSRAHVVLASLTRLPVIESCRGENGISRIITCDRGEWATDGESHREHSSGVITPQPRLPQLHPDDVALIMYTGGTTGQPKGVVHRQRGFTTNLVSHVLETEITARDRLLLSSPLPHSAGFLALTGLLQGAVTHIERTFDLDVVLDRIERDRVSYLFMVPTMIYRLLDAVEARDEFDAGSLRTILYGASPITEERLRQGLRLFGPVFMQLYGQTEAPNFLTRLRRDDHSVEENPERLRSCGQSVLLARVRTVRGDGTDCDPGEVGEVIGSSPYVMDRYLGKPEATRSTVRDGWLYTGDLGYLDDDGYLYLVDRKNDMIITGGFNVYASEVEQALAGLTGVKEAAIVGVPHPDWGEAVVAFVTPSTADITPEQILQDARSVLTGYKRPKEVLLTQTLPVTAVGKIDKKQLRRIAEQ